jgi:hypothetical protein
LSDQIPLTTGQTPNQKTVPVAKGTEYQSKLPQNEQPNSKSRFHNKSMHQTCSIRIFLTTGQTPNQEKLSGDFSTKDSSQTPNQEKLSTFIKTQDSS